FLGLADTTLPRIRVYLCEFLPDSNGQAAGADTRRDPEAAEIWTVVNSESPGANPSFELTQLLLHKVYGPATPDRRFWYDGLAGHMAAKGGSEYYGVASERVQKLFDAGQLPQLTDLLALYGIRQSAAGTLAATAFVGFLIEEERAERYKRFLHALGNDSDSAFQQVYRRPVQSLE